MSKCKNSDCVICKSNADIPDGDICPVCGKKLIPDFPLPDEFENEVISTYPYLIAYPLSRLWHPDFKTYSQRTRLVADIFTNTLKYIALIIASDFFYSEKRDKTLADLFLDNIGKKVSLGNWNAFLRDGIKRMDELNFKYFADEIRKTYLRIETKKGKHLQVIIETERTDEYGVTKIGKRLSESLIGALINFRNRYIGHRSMPSENTLEDAFNMYYPVLKNLLKEFSCFTQFNLMQFDGIRNWLLMGNEITPSTGNISRPEEGTSTWLQTNDGRQLPLVPFVILPREYIADVPDTVKMFVYEELADKYIKFVSPEGEEKETSSQVLKKLKLMITDKKREKFLKADELINEDIRKELENHSDFALKELTREGKLIDGIYQPRNDAESSIKGFTGSSYGLYFLQAGAGSGKTCLFAEMYRELKQKNTDVLFLRSGRFMHPTLDSELRDIFNLEKNEKWSDVEFLKREMNNPFVIIIDGGNEHPKPEIFLSSVYDFLISNKGGGVKVLLSWRLNASDSLPEGNKNWEEITYPASVSDNQQDENKDNYQISVIKQNSYFLTAFDKKEQKECWERYTSKKEYKTHFTLSDVVYFDCNLSDRFGNPLIMRIFLELFKGKSLPVKKKKHIHLWLEYLNNIDNDIPGAKDFLIMLAEFMLEKGNTIIDIDDETMKNELKIEIKSQYIDSPYRRLVVTGILSEFRKEFSWYVTFTIESLFIYVLSLVIREKDYINDTIALKNLLNNPPVKGFNDAVSKYLTDEAVKGDITRLIEWIDYGDEFIKISGYALAHAFDEIDSVLILKKLFENPTINDLKVILETDEYLKKNSRVEIRKKILNYIYDNWTEKENEYYIDILFEHCGLSNNKNTEIILTEIYKLFDKVEIKSKKISDYLLRIGNNLKNLNKFDDALQNYERSLDICKNEYGEFNEKTAKVLRCIGNIYYYKNNYESALGYYEKALNILIKLFGEENTETATTYGCIGNVYKSLSRFEKALEYYEKSLNIRRKLLGEENTNIATSYNNIGSVYDSWSRYEKALKYYEKALGIRIKLLGEENVLTAFSYSKIGSVYISWSRYEKALEYYKKVLSIRKKLLGEENIETATSYSNIGVVYKSWSQYEKALEYYNKALQIKRRLLSEENTAVATIYSNIGSVYDSWSQYEKALEYYDKALQIRIKLLGEENTAVATSYSNIGSVYQAKGQYEKALEYHGKALGIRKKLLGEENTSTAASYSNIGFVYKSLSQYDNALVYFENALKIENTLNLEKTTSTAIILNNIGSIYQHKCNYEKAKINYDKALQIKLGLLGENNLSTAKSFRNIGELYTLTEEFSEAKENLSKALLIIENLNLGKTKDAAMVIELLGDNENRQNNTGKANECYRKSYEIFSEVLGKENEATKKVLNKINRS